MQKKAYSKPEIEEIGRLNEVINTQRDSRVRDGIEFFEGNQYIALTLSTV